MSQTHTNRLQLLEKQQGRILDAMHFLWKHPETGYREWKSQEYLAAEYEKLGYTLTYAGNIPGFYTDIDTGRPGPTLLILAELDALFCATHPDADPETGAVHACGHCAQSASLLGIAAVLKQPGALDGLCGKIRLMEVPAEECVEMEFRNELRRKGIIRYFGGKQEFIARGYMDDVDMAVMTHSSPRPAGSATIGCEGNGFMPKTATFHGNAVHAATNPHLGINALYAAQQALGAMNALRETFRESDYIRMHPIIANGCGAVNTIPDTVVIENAVRGASIDAIIRENKKVNRAVVGAALSLGANVTLCDRPGYMPVKTDIGMREAALEACTACFGRENVIYPKPHGPASTDMGDLTTLIPTVYMLLGGATGIGHGNNYYVPDELGYCMNSARVLLTFADILLSGNAERANQIISDFQPLFADKEAYIRTMESMVLDIEAITYQEDGSAVVHWANE